MRFCSRGPMPLPPTWAFRGTLPSRFPGPGSATTGLGIAKDPERPSLYHVILGDSPAKDAIVPTEFEGLHLISADKNLVGANLELVDIRDREYRLRERIAEIRNEYRYIIID